MTQTRIEIKVTDRFGNVYTQTIENNKLKSYVQKQILLSITVCSFVLKTEAKDNLDLHFGRQHGVAATSGSYFSWKATPGKRVYASAFHGIIGKSMQIVTGTDNGHCSSTSGSRRTIYPIAFRTGKS
ncbi:hypothetical protein NXW37_29580 [Bacteroides thetaiotaomicron]|nr:hypothetical protein [Bacteroides thetaiotaomicron]